MYSKVSRLTFTLQTDTTKSCYNLHSTCICICSTCSGLLLCLSVKYLSSPIGQPCCIACVVVIWSQCCGSVAWADWQSQKLGANAHRLVVHHIKNPCRRLHQIMLLQIRCETLLWLWTTCACPVSDAFQAPWWIMVASGNLWFVNTRFNYKKDQSAIYQVQFVLQGDVTVFYICSKIQNCVYNTGTRQWTADRRRM